MNIHLKNIGIIKNSDIQIDGLTVITGKNSSGKTTVGKVLYSLIEATSNVEQKAENDKKSFTRKTLEAVKLSLDIFRFMYVNRGNIENSSEVETSNLEKLFDSEYYHNVSFLESEEFVCQLYKELRRFDVEKLIESGKITKRYAQLVSRTGDINEVANILRTRIRNANNILEKYFFRLSSDSELINYTRESISQTLNVEFAEQIQPINNPEEDSYIELYDEESVFYKICIRKNQIINRKTPVFISSPFSKVFFVDDPFVLDKPSIHFISAINDGNIDSVLDTRRIFTHDICLADTLRSKKNTTVFEDATISEEITEIKNQINLTIPGTFEFSSKGEYYVKDGKKLKFSNLATGSKMFSIIKILMEKGLIDKNTLLILDEPEAHLHPNWQNIFAEIIVMLVSKLDVKVVLTTHSSNFMLAIDAFMRKYKMNSKCNFYQTEYLEEGFVNYKCVNDDMGQIYSDFMEYLSQVKILRNEYFME